MKDKTAKNIAHNIEGVKLGSELPPKTMYQEIVEDKEKAKWVKDVEDFCNTNNITPKDLIAAYFKPVKKKVEVKDLTPQNSSGESYLDKRRKMKLGISDKK